MRPNRRIHPSDRVHVAKVFGPDSGRGGFGSEDQGKLYPKPNVGAGGGDVAGDSLGSATLVSVMESADLRNRKHTPLVRRSGARAHLCPRQNGFANAGSRQNNFVRSGVTLVDSRR